MKNIGGDYWEVTVEFDAGTAVEYKFYTNANDTVFAGAEWEGQGWEGDLEGGNRTLTVGSEDEVIPVQFVNGWKAGATQFEAPFTSHEDTVTVWIRVNVQGYADFNPDLQVIGVRGAAHPGFLGNLSWASTLFLEPEENHANGGSQQYTGSNFWSGAIKFPKDSVDVGEELPYKFVIAEQGNATDVVFWESDPNRTIKIPENKADTTAHWDWLDRQAPIVVDHQDEVIVTWVADLASALNNRGFSYGDTIQVRSGYYGTATETRTKMMRRMGLSTRYTAIDTVMTTIGAPLDYQYYIIKNGVEYREVYYNFLYDGETVGEAERRMSTVSSAEMTIEDIETSQLDVHRMPEFRNTSILTQAVMVTFTCDARPAIYQVAAGDMLDDIQGIVDVTDPDQVLNLGMIINGPATGGWGTWGPPLLEDEDNRMYDDGTHGDAVAGDSIFSIQISYDPDSMDVVGQEFKFGIGGGDNEGGYGNNHIENIDDTNPTFTLASQFGSIDPVFYDAWDFDTQSPSTGVEDNQNAIPTEFALQQNYPNPFNPTTTIQFSLPEAVDVTLKVFNMRGQEVRTLVNSRQGAGYYAIEWNGTDNNGNKMTSGLYLYKIVAGDNIVTKKMLLMK
jgi:hypothetical protein